MNVDPTRNVVLFLARRGAGEPLLAEAPTRDDDCVEQAWEIVQYEHRARASEVGAVHSEWQPSARDAAFIARSFPGADLTYNFTRPVDGNWADAFAAARSTIEAGLAAELAEAAAAAAAPPAALPASAGGRAAGAVAVGPPRDEPAQPEPPAPDPDPDPDEDDDGRAFLPVLCGPSSSRGAVMAKYLVRIPLVPDAIDVVFAMIGPTPHGTIGMDWFTVSEYQQLGEPEMSDVLAVACHNLARGLTITERTAHNGAKILELNRPVWNAAAAVVLPDFLAQIGKPLKSNRLVIGIPNPDQLFVAAAGTEGAQDVRDMTLESSCTDMYLGPTVLEMDADGIRVLDQRQV